MAEQQLLFPDNIKLESNKSLELVTAFRLSNQLLKEVNSEDEYEDIINTISNITQSLACPLCSTVCELQPALGGVYQRQCQNQSCKHISTCKASCGWVARE